MNVTKNEKHESKVKLIMNDKPRKESMNNKAGNVADKTDLSVVVDHLELDG